MEYPRNQMEFDRAFANEDDCVKYLIEVKWPLGYRCSKCSHNEYWALSRKRLKCKKCLAIATITSNTFFDQSNKALTLWLRAIWWMIAQKNGVSASGLQAILGIGSYKTAWIWLHKLRMLMVFPNRDKLSGKVEIDETFVGGVAEGKRGRGAENKSLVMIAVEVLPKGTGRVRLELIPSAEGKHLLKFISENVEKGTTVITDGWSGYAQLSENGYEHIKQKQVIASHNEEMLPNVQRIAALLKRWLLGTHQNYTSQDRLQKYLDEFSFRYNRRKSNSRGLLFHRIIEQAMIRQPILSRDVLENKI
ncbi:MAG: IS1595 family transposase [Cyclobacteriaceae bacterium]|nr:IS1595 family transposase [Cyclobacteriaceae bacterium]